jgi:hypothetical protein
VLARSDDFTLPFDVTRRPIRRPRHPAAPGSGRKDFAPLSAAAVARGRSVFADELDRLAIGAGWSELDALRALRRPVALSTVAALHPDAGADDRDAAADLALAWVDALGPIIAADRPPRAWSAVRRGERRARRRLIDVLTRLGSTEPANDATALAAGVQVPIAAGAWALTLLAAAPETQERAADPTYAAAYVWEVLRLYPPTWLLARITTRDVQISQTTVPAYTPVVVSPVALGRLDSLVPGPAAGHAPLDRIDAGRWRDPQQRPGAWLPFGSGVHACPGRNLGLAQLVALVSWAGAHEWAPTAPVGVDARRGLAPSPSTVRVRRKAAS